MHVTVRGKAGAGAEFGSTLLIVEQTQGLIVDWRLYRRPLPSDARTLMESFQPAPTAYNGRLSKSVVTDEVSTLRRAAPTWRTTG